MTPPNCSCCCCVVFVDIHSSKLNYSVFIFCENLHRREHCFTAHMSGGALARVKPQLKNNLFLFDVLRCV